MRTKKMKVEDLEDNQKMIITKKELLEMASETAVDAVGEFIKQCGEMAEANWCPSMVEDLQRLFSAVLKGEPYSEPPEEEK